MTKREIVEIVHRWRTRHFPKTYDENWYIQNLLGDILGWGTPEQEEMSQLFAPEQPTQEIEYPLRQIPLQDFKPGKSVAEIMEAMKQAAKEDLFKQEEIEPLDLNINEYLDGRGTNLVKATDENVDNLWWRTNRTRNKVNELVEAHKQLSAAVNALQKER